MCDRCSVLETKVEVLAALAKSLRAAITDRDVAIYELLRSQHADYPRTLERVQ